MGERRCAAAAQKAYEGRHTSKSITDRRVCPTRSPRGMARSSDAVHVYRPSHMEPRLPGSNGARRPGRQLPGVEELEGSLSGQMEDSPRPVLEVSNQASSWCGVGMRMTQGEIALGGESILHKWKRMHRAVRHDRSSGEGGAPGSPLEAIRRTAVDTLALARD